MNRCPVCGEDRVFAGLWRIRHHCHACRYRYVREQGYFLGAIYLNYGLTGGLALGLFYWLAPRLDWDPRSHMVYLVPFVLLFPVLFFRWSRLLWMAMDLSFSRPADEDFLAPPEEHGAARPQPREQL